MPRPRKVPPGSITRSILFRAEQIDALERAAAGAAADVSDLVRAAVDLLYPPGSRPGYADRVRSRAALERCRRAIGGRGYLVDAVVRGCARPTPAPPDVPGGRAAAALVREAVAILLTLYDPQPAVPDRDGRIAVEKWTKRWHNLACDWFDGVSDPLLAVLGCTAAWAHHFPAPDGPDPRPGVLYTVPALAAAEGEKQYRLAAAAVGALRHLGVLELAPAGWPWPLLAPFALHAYAVRWDVPAAGRVGARTGTGLS
jgi:hypothetical protein